MWDSKLDILKGLGLDNDFILELILFFPGFVQIFGSQNSRFLTQ